MLERKVFDEYMKFFEKQFDKKLGFIRKEMLYKKVASFDSNSFSGGLISAIEKFNSHQLPSIEILASMTSQYSHPFSERKEKKVIG